MISGPRKIKLPIHLNGKGRNFEETITSPTCKKKLSAQARSIVEVDGCSNLPVCNDETLLQFRDFDALDGDAFQITFKLIGKHVLQITAVALVEAPSVH